MIRVNQKVFITGNDCMYRINNRNRDFKNLVTKDVNQAHLLQAILVAQIFCNISLLNERSDR